MSKHGLGLLVEQDAGSRGGSPFGYAPNACRKRREGWWLTDLAWAEWIGLSGGGSTHTTTCCLHWRTRPAADGGAAVEDAVAFR